jgi:hypothetical protein
MTAQNVEKEIQVDTEFGRRHPGRVEGQGGGEEWKNKVQQGGGCANAKTERCRRKQVGRYPRGRDHWWTSYPRMNRLRRNREE